jgi:hypothetical protein
MQDTHRQWDVLLSSELEYEKIKGFPVILLPSSISLTDANFAALEMFLANGGRVLATGTAGQRHGPEGHTLKRKTNPLEGFKKFEGFRRVTAQPGARYWLDKDAAAAERMNALIAWPGFRPSLATDAGIHVGVTLSRSRPGDPPCLSLDLNNNHLDPGPDRFTPSGAFSVSVRVPEGMEPPFAVSVAEPEKEDREMPAGSLRFDAATRKLAIDFPPLDIFRFVRIQAGGGSSPAPQTPKP